MAQHTRPTKVIVNPKDGAIEITLNVHVTVDGKVVADGKVIAEPDDSPYMVPDFLSGIKLNFGKTEG